LAYSQDFSNTAGKVKFGMYCYGRDENRTGYHPGLIQLFRGIFFQGIWRKKLSREGKKGNYAAVCAFPSVPTSSFWGWICKLFGALAECQATQHTSVSRRNSCYQPAILFFGRISYCKMA